MIKSTIDEHVKYYTDRIICCNSNADIESIVYDILYEKRKFQFPGKSNSIRKAKIIYRNHELERENEILKKEIEKERSNMIIENEKWKHGTYNHLRDIVARNEELFKECGRLYIENEKLKSIKLEVVR